MNFMTLEITMIASIIIGLALGFKISKSALKERDKRISELEQEIERLKEML